MQGHTSLPQQYLPCQIQKYVTCNAAQSSEYQSYDSSVPVYLHNRPCKGILHCLNSTCCAKFRSMWRAMLLRLGLVTLTSDLSEWTQIIHWHQCGRFTCVWHPESDTVDDVMDTTDDNDNCAPAASTDNLPKNEVTVGNKLHIYCLSSSCTFEITIVIMQPVQSNLQLKYALLCYFIHMLAHCRRAG